MSPSATAAEQQTMQRLNQKIASERDDLITGEDQVAGCHLPSHSDVHYSSLTGERIQVCHLVADVIYLVTVTYIIAH